MPKNRPPSAEESQTALHNPPIQEKSATSSSGSEAAYTVVKRNGALVPFRRERIVYAIEAAFRDTKKISKEHCLPSDIKETVEEVTALVVEQVLNAAAKGACLSVEGIQDVIEVTLMKEHQDVARDYIIYRDLHKSLREDSPHNLKIRRHDGTLVSFNPIKVASSLEEAFRRTQQNEGPPSQSIVDAVNLLTQNIVAKAVTDAKSGHELSVNTLQDEIEYQLMREGFFSVAKEYILYRAALGEQSPGLEAAPAATEKEKESTYSITLRDGTLGKMTEKSLRTRIKFACRGLEKLTSIDDLTKETIANFYEGIKEGEIDQAFIMAARAKIEMEPVYSKVAARLLLDILYRESLKLPASDPSLESRHRKYFKEYLQYGIEIKRVHPDLLKFDLDILAKAMHLQRDDLFGYLGLQTLYDRYFIHDHSRRLETPQIFWMRVAMGLAINEGEQRNQRAIEFYDLLSRFHYTSSTPTLFNSGTLHPQLSSCYLSTVLDDLSHIFKVVSDDAQLSKWAGGIGNDWTNVRATGSVIKGTNGKSQGVIPFLKVANDTAVAVNQCFAPETTLYTAQGVKPISEVQIGDLVLGISGTYREITDKFVYNQKDPMIAIKIQHSLEPLAVTSGHPFYALRGVPKKQGNERTLADLKAGKLKCEWIDAGQLQKGDYIAQVIPKEIVRVPEIDQDDARLYGILLADGHLSQDNMQWTLSSQPKCEAHLEFVRNYLQERGIHFWETGHDETLQIHWAASRSAVRDATTDAIRSVAPTLPFDNHDIYDCQGRRHIAPRLSHLPRPQALALIQGLIETNKNASLEKEITFSTTSQPLIEGLRYQLLRMGVPTAGNLRVNNSMQGATTSYDLQIPAIPEVAAHLNCQALTKSDWLTFDEHIFTRITKIESIDVKPLVCDLQVEGDESYMTTAGLAHNGGKRKGAMCAYLETWHLDIEDFLELRKNTGDERRRTHDMNTANWIPDLFMKRVQEGGMWTLFSPADCPDLHDLYGRSFEARYVEYEKMADEGAIKLFKRVEALYLWRKMLSMLFETGHPWITFKDPSNIRSSQDHVGVVHSSNLCTEILLNTSAEETAVCNLGSVNLALHLTPEGTIDETKLRSTIRTAVRMLDNVIDINYYPTPEARTANQRHRPIGLGVMGFQDALYMQNISYASHAAVEFADASMELISYYAILASSELAAERGSYQSYKGSKWSRNLLPIDTIELLAKERGGSLDVDRSSRLDWTPVRDSIKKHGMRNSNTMAIAPTATISNITGVTQSIEPMYKHLFVKSNLSGEFTIPNEFLVAKLKQLGLWDSQMLDDLKYFDGSISEIERIPAEIKQIFLTAFEIEPEWMIECASRRQKWIDMGQSLNLYLAKPSGKKLHQMYLFSWTKGLKTNYYLRALAATQIEKSTTDVNKRGLQPRWMKNQSASSNIQVNRETSTPSTDVVTKPNKPLACSLEEGCESCQ